MEYKDIKTADELESWYAEKQAVLDSHARDYMVPFGFVYHLDCSGYVSFERWNDTLPTAEEQTAFQAIQNGVSTKEIIEHKDEFGWTDRACRDAEEYDLAPCFIVPARKEYMQEQEIMNVRELYPELIGPDGEIIWSDPDFAKQGNEEAAGPDNFPGHELNDHKNPDQSWISVIPVQMYWKDDPSELVEANFSIEDTCGLAIDEQITFSGYNENELVDMIGREDNGEDFVITGVGPQSSILTEKKNPAHGRRLSDKQAKAKTAAGRLDAEREPKAGIPIHDVEHLTTIDAYMEQICRIFGRIADEIVGYNVAFDIGFLKAAGATINPDAAIIDTMQEFMDAFGNSNTGHRYQPLSMAAERLGYNWTSAPHGSLSDTLACLAAQKCVDDHNWCVENLELTEDAIMHAKPIENGSEGLPKDCWDLNPGGRPFAVTEPILHRLQSSAKLCARAGTTTQFTRMTVNQWFDKAERSQRSPFGRSVDIGRAASALNSQHEHAEVPQDLTK